MSRPKRRHRRNINSPGDAHALNFCCYDKLPLLSKDRTCKWLAESIQQARVDFDFRVWAYVFMPEHVHLLIHPRNKVYDIAQIREAVKEPVAKRAMEYLEICAPEWLDRLTRRRGKRTERLFWLSGGGFDRNIWNGKVLEAEIDYIHRNPVRRGLVKDPSDWKWSSASWYLKKIPGPIPIDPIPPEWFT